MADNIKLDKSGMESAIKLTENAKECYDTAISDLEKVIYNLQEVWNGDSQVAMFNRYEESKAAFKRFSVEIGEYINGMKKTQQELPEEDSRIATIIDSLQ